MSDSADQTPMDAVLAEPSSLNVVDKNAFKSSGTECPIYYSDADTETFKMTCSHIFHRECLQTWLQTLEVRSGTCPSCRAVLYEGTPTSGRENGYRGYTMVELPESQREAVQLMREIMREDPYGTPTGAGVLMVGPSTYNAYNPRRADFLTRFEANPGRHPTYEGEEEAEIEAEAAEEGERSPEAAQGDVEG